MYVLIRTKRRKEEVCDAKEGYNSLCVCVTTINFWASLRNKYPWVCQLYSHMSVNCSHHGHTWACQMLVSSFHIMRMHTLTHTHVHCTHTQHTHTHTHARTPPKNNNNNNTKNNQNQNKFSVHLWCTVLSSKMPQTEMWNYFMFASDMVTNTAWSAALGVTLYTIIYFIS